MFKDAVTYEHVTEARRRIVSDVVETPLLRAHDFDPGVYGSLWLKLENLQRTGSFKARGALNWIRNADDAQLSQGLITVSAGNHALALAWAARQSNARVTVVMPEASSPFKVEATRAYGARVILHGVIYDALEKMAELREREGLHLVHPYDDPAVIAGQGTIGLELNHQLADIHSVLCPIGGGGLISGIGVALKRLHPEVKLIGVEPEGAATMQYAWQCGGPKALPRVTTLAASLGAAVAGEYSYALSKRYVDDIVTVSDEEIVAALRTAFASGRIFAEPGSVATLAALQSGKVTAPPQANVVCVVSGGNLDQALLRSLL